MGVAGVAVATDIANIVSALLIIILLIKEKEPYRLDIKRLQIEKSTLKRMLMIGIPAGLQGMVFSFSNVLVQTTINSHGAAAIAGSAAALNFEFYCYFIISAFNGAAISFIGQNYGAGNIKRVKRIFWICMVASIIGCGAFNTLFVWQHKFFIGLFSSDEAVQAYAFTRMRIVLAVQFIACSYEISASALRGMSISLPPTIMTIIGTCILRMIWVFAVCPVWQSFDTIMLVYPISWVVTGVMISILFYLRARKKLKIRHFQGIR